MTQDTALDQRRGREDAAHPMEVAINVGSGQMDQEAAMPGSISQPFKTLIVWTSCIDKIRYSDITRWSQR